MVMKLFYLFMLFPILLFSQIEGTVTSTEPFKYEGRIYTKNIITNKYGHKEEIITRGGFIGLEGEIVSDSPQLAKGMKGRFYKKDNFLAYIEPIDFFQIAEASANPQIISAGNKKVLTIEGSGFGLDQGTVEFPHANYGGLLKSPALDSQVLYWDDSKIKVEVPSFAGTGTVNVVKKDSTEILTNPITVDYAIINANYNNRAYRVRHVDKYIWQFNQNFQERDAFITAFNQVVCSSGIDWEIGEDSQTNLAVKDGINLILFSSELSSATLGRCTTYFEGCANGDGVVWYVKEMDIVFNANKNWSFTDTVSSNQTHFITVAIHELLHGHQLGHVIGTNFVMHYSLGANTIRDLSQPDYDAMSDVMDLNVSESACGNPIMTAQSCTLGYKNPEYEFPFDMAAFTIYDMAGRENLNAKGIVIVKYEFNGKVVVRKEHR